MKTAAAYVRVSTDDQVEFSPDSQIKALKNYAQKNEMILPNEFIFLDEGISGKSTSKRTQFNNMITLAKNKPKPFDVILVWKYSRFARNREDSVVYKSMLRKELGIDVVSISEDVGDDKMSIIFEAMIEAMDEYYSINLAEEVKRGMTEKAKRGGVLSIPPFGYSVKDGQFVTIPYEAQIIKKVFSDYVNGDGFLTIAKSLNELGVRTHRGSKIESRTVEYWLNNPAYIGKTRWNPTGATSRNYQCKDVIISDGNHEAIIDPETWKAAQQKMIRQKEKYKKYRRTPDDTLSNWCTGLIRCGVCGGAMSYMAGHYQCNKKYKGICTGNGSIMAKKLNRIVIEYLENILDGKIIYIDSCPKSKASTSNDVISKKDIYKTEISRLNIRLQRIREAYEVGIDSLEEYRHNKTKLQDEIRKIEDKIKGIDEIVYPEEPAIINKGKIKTLLEVLKDNDVSEQEKNIHACKIIKEIVKTGDDGRTIKIVLWK